MTTIEQVNHQHNIKIKSEAEFKADLLDDAKNALDLALQQAEHENEPVTIGVFALVAPENMFAFLQKHPDTFTDNGMVKPSAGDYLKEIAEVAAIPELFTNGAYYTPTVCYLPHIKKYAVAY